MKLYHAHLFFFFPVSCFVVFNVLNLFKSFKNSCGNKYFDLKERLSSFFTITIIFVKAMFTVIY